MKLIIFDIDGTLIDSNSAEDACFINAVKSVFKLNHFDTNWENYSSVTDSGIIEEVSLKCRGALPLEKERASIESLHVELLRGQPQDSFLPIPGAELFFNYLKSNTYHIAIATGSWRMPAQYKLQVAGIDVEGIPMATSSDALTREAIMQAAYDRVCIACPRVEFEEVIYFGDGIWDAKACINLGWRLIGIGNNCAKLEALGASASFKDYQEPDLILKALFNS